MVHPPSSPHRLRGLLPAAALLLAVLLASCNLVSQDADDLPTITPRPDGAGKPAVAITSPREGEQFQVDREILVTASATDEIGITRVQLLANDQPVRTVLSETDQGDRQKNVALGYTPRSAGQVTLKVVAFRGTVASDPAQISVNIVSQAVATATSGGGGSGPGPSIPTIDPNDPTCRARARSGLNLRQGPSTDFPVLTVLSAGQSVPIIGRLGDNSWWQVRSGTTVGWVFAELTDVFGTCTTVPIVGSPITVTPTSQQPTITPSPTLTPTVIVPTVTQTPSPADLRIEAFDGPRTLTLGEDGTVTGTFNMNVANTGGRASGAFDVTYRLFNLTTPGDSEPQFLPEFGSLRRGEVIALEFEITFDAPGVYRIEVEADASRDVPESDEGNNRNDLTITVRAAP